MEQAKENLISKKELLSRYGISYGALYRWKRKGLIPEDWFIKMSAVTGQETYFPAEAVCERIELILSSKEDVLLDELAKALSKESKTAEVLVIDTVYGKKTFQLRDINDIYLEAEGGSIDLKSILNEMIDNKQKGE